MSSDKSLEAARKMHSDVLESNPADHESKERLAEEIKSRGNLALKHDRLHEVPPPPPPGAPAVGLFHRIPHTAAMRLA